jgi:hypothetical protein
MQPNGRSREAELLGNRHEIAKLAKIKHVGSPPIYSVIK